MEQWQLYLQLTNWSSGLDYTAINFATYFRNDFDDMYEEVKGLATKDDYIQISQQLESLETRIEKGEVTIITESLSRDDVQFIQECKLIIAYIKYKSKELADKMIHYDYQLAISEKDFVFLPVQYFRAYLSNLVDLGLK